MKRTLLARNADVLVTMDARRREIRGGGVYVEGSAIVAVGTSDELPPTADEVIDLAGHVVVPGLVNTHHHMYQTLTRAMPLAQDARSGNTRFVFVDDVAERGHYWELYEPTPSLVGFYDMVRDANRGWDGTDPVRTLGAR